MKGVLVDVQARSITDADSITLRDQAGKVYLFRVSPGVTQDPDHPTNASHLRAHMAQGQPVIVTYEDAVAGLLAVRVIDAAPGG
ncbi:MAG: hypothetical protein EXR50_03550 [Dehalococcoidia bacterium]|nr:hypothetical protein [Dehalococcoidia bacterium]